LWKISGEIKDEASKDRASEIEQVETEQSTIEQMKIRQSKGSQRAVKAPFKKLKAKQIRAC